MSATVGAAALPAAAIARIAGRVVNRTVAASSVPNRVAASAAASRMEAAAMTKGSTASGNMGRASTDGSTTARVDSAADLERADTSKAQTDTVGTARASPDRGATVRNATNRNATNSSTGKVNMLRATALATLSTRAPSVAGNTTSEVMKRAAEWGQTAAAAGPVNPGRGSRTIPVAGRRAISDLTTG